MYGTYRIFPMQMQSCNWYYFEDWKNYWGSVGAARAVIYWRGPKYLATYFQSTVFIRCRHTVHQVTKADNDAHSSQDIS